MAQSLLRCENSAHIGELEACLTWYQAVDLHVLHVCPQIDVEAQEKENDEGIDLMTGKAVQLHEVRHRRES